MIPPNFFDKYFRTNCLNIHPIVTPNNTGAKKMAPKVNPQNTPVIPVAVIEKAIAAVAVILKHTIHHSLIDLVVYPKIAPKLIGTAKNNDSPIPAAEDELKIIA